MFRVTADSIGEYFAFDPDREADLRQVDRAIRAAAPTLKRWFVRGAQDDGKRASMIGYGDFLYAVKTPPGATRWPVLGLALQKNHLSLYCGARRGERPFALEYASLLGRVDVSAAGAIRFAGAEQLNLAGLAAMLRGLESGLGTGSLTPRSGRHRK